MKESYCIVDKRVTPCTEPSGYQKDKRGRTQFYCKCTVCGNKKVRYVKMGSVSQTGGKLTGSGKKRKTKKKSKKLIGPSEKAGGDVFDTVVGTAADAFVEHALPWMGRKAVEMGRYGASEFMRNKKLQKKAVNYGINNLTPFIQDSVETAMDQLSTNVRPKKKYKTDRKDLDGRSGKGIDPMTVVKKSTRYCNENNTRTNSIFKTSLR